MPTESDYSWNDGDWQDWDDEEESDCPELAEEGESEDE